MPTKHNVYVVILYISFQFAFLNGSPSYHVQIISYEVKISDINVVIFLVTF